MTPQIKQWNKIWNYGLLGMSEKECSDTLCFFHGWIKSNIASGKDVTTDEVIKAMQQAIDNVKAN